MIVLASFLDKTLAETITDECLPKEWRPIVSRDAHIVRGTLKGSSDFIFTNFV